MTNTVADNLEVETRTCVGEGSMPATENTAERLLARKLAAARASAISKKARARKKAWER